MIPAVKLPEDSNVRVPIDVKLKPKWRLDPRRRVFLSASGAVLDPAGDLPKGTEVVYKIPSLAEADQSTLSKPEKELCRYVHVILPPGEGPEKYLESVRAWPAVAEARVAPTITLPQA